MPYVARIPAIIEMNKLGGYDNKHPRQQQTQLTGLGRWLRIKTVLSR
ncbi:hypothetical protein P20439_3412 [Pseudoalteromonas sp. BSi20439]|nr:hypothetical protein P20439_3412 [Pseudoalteromonas sp. BSi20439]